MDHTHPTIMTAERDWRMPIIIVEQEHVQSPAIKVPIPVLVVVELLIGARVSNHPKDKKQKPRKQGITSSRGQRQCVVTRNGGKTR